MYQRNLSVKNRGGGSHRTYIASHASGAVIHRLMPGGSIEFLVIPYKVRGELTVRCVMGKQNGRLESPSQTLAREVGEEAVDKNAGPFWCDFAPNPILLTELVDDQEDEGGYHLKIFQLVTLSKGEIRKNEFVDESGRYPEWHGPPEWMEAEAAIQDMENGRGSKPVHLRAVKTALVSGLSLGRNVYLRYGGVVERHCCGIELTRPVPIVSEYLKRFSDS